MFSTKKLENTRLALLALTVSLSAACATRSDYAIPVLSPESADYGLEHRSILPSSSRTRCLTGPAPACRSR